MKLMIVCFICGILVNLVHVIISASYSNCRLVPEDDLIYHRRIKQDPTRHFKLELVSFPEVLLDRENPRDTKVISCILCKDLHGNASSSYDSKCKILRGGVGRSFVTLSLSCIKGAGYDYDIKIYGH